MAALSAGMGGMLREWTFSATLEHKAARIKLRLLPQWIIGNLDADEVAQTPDPLRKYTAIKPFLTFRDFSASAKAGDAWEEVEKVVTCLRGQLPPNAQLKDWCRRCIQFVLADERTVSIDGERRLQAVAIGNKCNRSPYVISGHKTFMFTYQQLDKASAVPDTHHMAIGTVVEGHGYLLLVSCTREEELGAYVGDSLMPSFKSETTCALNVDVTYAECPHAKLQQMQDLFGVLRYFDRSAAIEFTLPMHPMHIKPDHSPLQSAGFGSLACLTLDLEVFQKLYDDEVSAGATGGGVGADRGTGSMGAGMPGMPRYKPNNVVLYMEVEDVVKIGFPAVMSVDQYASLKTKKLLDTFGDARVVGAPLSLKLGQRVGRSTTCTFSYEMEIGATSGSSAGTGRNQRRTMTITVKALIVTTLVGNHGATAVFFTKLGQAIFDSHLYIFQHLQRTLHFYTERELVGTFSKDNAAIIRLTREVLPNAYSGGGDRARPTLRKHLAAIEAATDGEAEGASIIVVKPTEDAAPGDAEAEAPATDEQDVADDESVVSVRDIAHLAHLEVLEEPTLLDKPPDDEADSPDASGTRDNADAAAEEESTSAAAARENSTPAMDENASMSGTARAAPEPAADDEKQPDAASPAVALPTEEDEAAVKALVQEALQDQHEHRGPALRAVYKSMCDEENAKPNSYLLQKLPDDPRFTTGIEELDLSFNYVGHAGFRAILRLLPSLPKLHTVHFNSMSLDNVDVECMCRHLGHNKTVRTVHMRNNARISLPASPHILRLLRVNRRITTLAVSGCAMSSELVGKIESSAAANRNATTDHSGPSQSDASPTARSRDAGSSIVPTVAVEADGSEPHATSVDTAPPAEDEPVRVVG